MTRMIYGLPAEHRAVPLYDMQATEEWLNHPRLHPDCPKGLAAPGYTLVGTDGRTLGVVSRFRSTTWGSTGRVPWPWRTWSPHDVIDGDRQVWLGLSLGDPRVYETSNLQQQVVLMLLGHEEDIAEEAAKHAKAEAQSIALLEAEAEARRVQPDLFEFEADRLDEEILIGLR